MMTERRVNRRKVLKVLAAMPLVVTSAAVITSLGILATTVLTVERLTDQVLRRMARRAVQHVNAIVGPSLRAVGIEKEEWASRYDDSQAFIMAGASPRVHVDQVGYRTHDDKVAKLTVPAPRFDVVDAERRTVVFRGHPRLRTHEDPASGDAIYDLDFSALTTPGRYYVDVPGVGRSFAFDIGDAIFDGVLSTVLRGFYLQRCGGAVVDDRWGHAACHLQDADAWGQQERRVDLTGGWHDAGDYGKYLPSATRAVSVLLSAYEFFPEAFRTSRSGPSTALPRVLAEVRWELAWLQKMQTASGGVRHKVTAKEWSGYVVPDEDRDQRFAFGISTAATAGFAAVMAAASRVYAPFDSGFAGTMRAAAEKAWSYLEQHPRIVPTGGFHNPAGVTTGAYLDADDADERFWAAAELFRATGASTYDVFVRGAFQRWRPYFTPPPSVIQTQGLGALAYLLAESVGGDQAIRAIMRDDLLRVAREIASRVDRQGYQVALAENDYYWGSNGVALSYAIALLLAERIAGEKEFARPALDQLHYIFGRNPLGKSFVTGVGANPVMRPYYEAAIAARRDTPAPGFLSGGPNAVQSRVLAAFPARDYVDDSQNYTVNETAIDMNAGLAFVLARFVDSNGG